LSELPDLQGRASVGNGGSTNSGHGEAASICGADPIAWTARAKNHFEVQEIHIKS